MRLTDKGLNPSAQAIEEAQADIRVIVRDGFMRDASWTRIAQTVQKRIERALKEIELPVLKSAALRSLTAFARKQYRRYVSEFGIAAVLAFMIAFGKKPDGKSDVKERKKAADALRGIPSFRDTLPMGWEPQVTEYGVPAQMYHKEYMEKVNEVMERMAEEVAMDPDDRSGRNSMRNRAEMEVRYQAHKDNIEQLRATGERLVLASEHADCSKRCAPWQGRVYSLDGTSGRTDDGRRFEPLETATDVYYTTKAGITYKNGLLGFNCRHYLVPYRKGAIAPKLTEEERRKEYEITQRQRQYEREIRQKRAEADMLRGIDDKRAAACDKRARELYAEYVEFSISHGRAYYPDRTKI